MLVWLQGPVAGQSWEEKPALPAGLRPRCPRGCTGLVFMVTESLFTFQPVPSLVSGTVSPSTP